MRRSLAIVFAVSVAVPLSAQAPQPVIDMHLHAIAADEHGAPPVPMCTPFETFPIWDPAAPLTDTLMALLADPPCPEPIWSPPTDEALMQQTIAVLERRHVFGVLSGDADRVDAWMAAAPGRFYPGLRLRLSDDPPGPGHLRARHADGRLAVLGEISNQYDGVAPDDPAMEPYWALAESLDLPVGIHIGPGPPGVVYLGSSGYRARLQSALTLEDVLVRHPRLRVYVMHAGFPLLDDLLAVLYAHPQVYVDTGLIVFSQPRAAFYRYLEGIVEAGFGNRVMFGSDQLVWPDVIELSIEAIEEAPFLDAAQKRAILYGNAARFLRLSREEIARHHGIVED